MAGQVDRPQTAPAKRDALLEATVEQRPAEQVLLSGQGEGERGDSQQESPDPEGTQADEGSRGSSDACRGQHRDQVGEAGNGDGEELQVVTDSDPELQAPVEPGSDQGTDPGERHLAERQLSGPAGHDGHRDGADSEGQDAGVQQVA